MAAETDARQRLAARQRAVLADLLAGDVPAGFDPLTAQATGQVLRHKRWRAAAAALPDLTGLPEAAAHFDDYARGTRRRGCAHTDAAAFLDWMAAADPRTGPAGHPGTGIDRTRSAAAARALRSRLAVESGDRRAVLVWQRGRPRLVVGWGDWVYDVPLVPGLPRGRAVPARPRGRAGPATGWRRPTPST